MKSKLIFLLLALSLCASAIVLPELIGVGSKTTVTGVLQYPSGSVVPKGTYVQFNLVGCGQNQSKVPGVSNVTPIFQVQATNGAVSTQLYGNNQISCGGVFDTTRWQWQFFVNNQPVGTICQQHIGGSSWDLNSNFCDNAKPTPAATPSYDVTHLRLDGGNQMVGNIVPTQDATYRLGADAARWIGYFEGGAIDAVPIGATYPSTGAFTTLNATTVAFGTFGATTGTFGTLNASGGGSLAGTFTGNPAFAGNPSYAGNPVFSGAPVISGNLTATAGQNIAKFYNINSTIIVDGNKYPTIAAAKAACPAAPASCRIVIPPNTTLNNVAAFTLGVAPCQDFYAQVLELSPGVKLHLSGKITLLCGAALRGSHRNAVYVVADGTGFPTSTPMIQMGDNSNLIDAQVEGLRLNCNAVSGCSGIIAQGLNENSYIAHNYTENFKVDGFKLDGATVNSANFIVEDNQFSPAASISGALINVISVGAAQFRRNSLVSNTLQPAGLKFSGSALTAAFPNTVYYAHCEEMTDCVSVDGTTTIIIEGLDSTAATVNTLHIQAGATGNVVANGLYNNANDAAKYVVKNDVTSTALASTNPPALTGAIPSYEWQNDAVAESWTDSYGIHPRRKAFANLGTPGNGTVLYCTDCNATCTAGASTGRTCFRENGAWTH